MADRVHQPVSVDSVILSLRVVFDPVAAGDATVALELVVGGEAFQLKIENGALDVHRGHDPEIAARLVTGPDRLAALLRGDETVTAGREGLTFTGDEDLIRKVMTYFRR